MMRVAPTDVSGKGNFKAVPNKDKDINSETRYIAYVFISLLIRSAIRFAQPTATRAIDEGLVFHRANERQRINVWREHHLFVGDRGVIELFKWDL